MQSEDIIVSKLLSLRFYQFSDADKRGLTSNIRGNGIRSGVSEAARIYLRTAIERGLAEADHLAGIADWLEGFGRAVEGDVVEEYRQTLREMTLSALFSRGGVAGSVPGF